MTDKLPSTRKMKWLPSDGPFRYRPRKGDPTCAVEYVAQTVWRWRIELMLVYLVVATSAMIAWWVIK